jgi:hypothetical protein
MRAASTRRAPLVFLLALLIVLPGRTVAAPRFAADASGLQLSLVLPRHSYPRNALVRVAVRLQNVSSSPVRIYRDACPNGSVFVEVVNRKGQVVYPPIVPGAGMVPCPFPIATYTLRPGQAQTRHVLAILRADRLRPVAVLPGETSVSTDLVTVPLTRGHAPRVTVRPSPQPEAVVQPAGQQSGPLYYADYGTCLDGSGWGHLRWQSIRAAAGTYTVRPPCHAAAWSLVAGFLGPPVASVRYGTPPPPVPTPAPIRSDVTVTFPPPSPSVSLRVGQTLALRVPILNEADPSAGPSWLARADPTYLRLLSAGPAPDGASYLYRWQALRAGSTILTVDPACLQHGCAIPSFALRVTIT